MKYLKANSILSQYNLIFTILGVLLIIPVTYLFYSEQSYYFLLFLFFLSISLILLYSIDITYIVFLILLFFPSIYLLRVHPAVIFSIVVFVSALINFKGNLYIRIKNPLWLPLVIYFFCTILSLLNSNDIILSLRDLTNLASLFIVFFVTIILITSQEKMKLVYLFFILAVLTHSLYVIYDGFTSGRRTFGILGVYYIDYAGLGSLLSFILLLYSKGLKKISYSILFFIISLGLIITQTRNAWLSTAFAIFTLIIYLFINSKKVFIKRYILGLLALLVVGLLIINLTSSGVDVSQRIDVESQSVTLTEDPESIGTNSFVSRIMIWHTAIVAFGEHPFIGIGAYAFKHTSQFYYKIPKGFHKLWVEGRTPHITFLQVLTETGIVGFVAFLFFIFVLIKLLLKTVKLPKTREEYIITIMTVWSLVYILFSMMMTESWLYGPYIIWFGILLGLLVNLFKLLSPPSQY